MRRHRIIGPLAGLFFLSGILFAAVRTHELILANTVTITWDGGGKLSDFVVKYNAMRQEGKRLVIDGPCISACTLALGLIPPSHMCVTPYAKIGIHSAYTRDFLGNTEFSGEGTRLEWHIYPENLRALLRTKYHWDGDDSSTSEHPEVIFIEGDELATLVKPCPTKRYSY